MARSGISYEQVVTAAEALIADRQRPTIDAVRVKLGTGSPNTIHRFLSDWRATRQNQPVNVELPSAVVAAIAAEITHGVARIRADLEKQLQDAQSEAVELSAFGERLEDEKTGLEAALATADAQRAAMRLQTEEQNKRIELLQNELNCQRQSTEAVRERFEDCRLGSAADRQKIADLMRNLNSLETRLNTESAARHAAEQAKAVLAARYEDAAQTARQASLWKTAHERLDIELASARRQVAELQTALELARKDAAKTAYLPYKLRINRSLPAGRGG